MDLFSKITFEELDNACKKSNTISDIAKNLNIQYCNGKVTKKIKELLLKFKLNFNTNIGYGKRIFEKIKKICPVCNNNFDTLKNHIKEKTACSRKCANVYFGKNKHSTESRLKISKSLLNRSKILDKICLGCQNKFKPKRKKSKYCSKECSLKRFDSIEYRENLKRGVRKSIIQGRHKGWAKRTNLSRSFPETYIENILNIYFGVIRDVDFVIELKVGKWFIDFAFEKLKIALEVDGVQHSLPERQISDRNKDDFLIRNGWKVCRIKWRKPDESFKNEIIKLLSGFFISQEIEHWKTNNR